MAFQSDTFQDDAFEGVGGDSSFSVNAVIYQPHFSANAVVETLGGGAFTASAVARKSQSGSFGASAYVAQHFRLDAIRITTITPPGGKPADAYIQLRITGDWTVDATLLKTLPHGMAADAFVQPWFAVDAETISNLFRVPINAVIFGPILRTTTANADIAAVGDERGLILLDAVVRATPALVSQAGIEAVRVPDPTADIEQAGAEVLWAPESVGEVAQAGAEVLWAPESVAWVEQAGAEVAWRAIDGLTKVSQAGFERARSGDPAVIASQFGVEIAKTIQGYAFLSQAGYEVAYEKPRTFTANALFFRPWEYMPPVTQTIDAALAWKIDGPPWTADAFIQWYMPLDAVRFQPDNEGSFTFDAALIIRRYGDFTLNAFTQGFLLNAVIEASGWYGSKQGIFNVYAVKGGPYLTVDAWIVGTPGDFTADAILHLPVTGSFTAGSWFIDFWWNKVRTLTADAVIQPEVSGSISDRFWAEAFIDLDQRTVVYDGEGETHVLRHLVTERLTFPGFPNPTGDGNTELAIDNANNLFGPFTTIDQYPVTITLHDIASWGDRSIGVHGMYQNHWSTASGPGNYEFWPADGRYESFVYSSHGGVAYEADLTGEGLVSYYLDDVITDALPAPTLDAWIVGTEGEPFTVDAEIVGAEKLRVTYADAWVNDEVNWQTFSADAFVKATRVLFFSTFAVVADRHLYVDALVHQPHLDVDAFIRPYFTVAATTRTTITPVDPVSGKGFPLDAVKVRGTRSSSTTADAYLFPESGWGNATMDAVLFATMTTEVPGPQRFYLAATIGHLQQSFSLDAFVGHQFAASAFIQPSFTVGAYVRGSSYIIFPEDGGPPTDPFGNPPMIGRNFKIRIEAGIADPIPIGNDAEIERLIDLIIEAEAELEALYCAVTHYESQGAPVAGGRNPTGGGKTGSLPAAIAQAGYPGGGDVDDCWVVADVWAALASGETFRPTIPQYRRWAHNPDRPGPTGGTIDHSMRAARVAWPNAKIRRYHSTDWDGFTSLLKAGWSASLSIRLNGLPSSWRYGYRDGLHRIGVAYQNGQYYYMDPNQNNGSSPRSVSGHELRTAARAHSGGTIHAVMFR